MQSSEFEILHKIFLLFELFPVGEDQVFQASESFRVLLCVWSWFNYIFHCIFLGIY